MYNLMSQALMTLYFNDWLGWFSPGYSGFHPQKRFDTKREQRKREFHFILNFL